MPKKLTKKAIENKMYELAQSMISGVQFDVWDLGKLVDAGIAAFTESQDEEKARAAISEAIAKYRKN